MSKEGTRLTAGESVLQQFTQKINKFQNLNSTSVPKKHLKRKYQLFLDGSIPTSSDNLKLSSLDLSINQLSGRVPTDLLTVGGEKTFLGNKGLCVDQSIRNIRMNSGMVACS
ncbi:hypothetical protein H5410_056221 [Solanum commersonii]|uniref:Uncharacterized protein n=1 Tax=Solanum commersonii TaxID=4109 RepID=A0A9J5WLI2_SOLCO|nr:hypothetical protein H5410_056221 [Solanum commersonii]